jgi:putative chitinase
LVKEERRMTTLMDVREIQRRLIKLGYSCGPAGADGLLGPATEAAVRAFQRATPPLTVDGKPGVQTQAALRKKTDVSPIGPSAAVMTASRLRLAFPRISNEMVAAFDTLKDEIDAAGLTTGKRCAHFLAQVAIESGYLTKLEEDLRYSAIRLREVFPSKVKTDAQAQQLAAAGPQAIANYLYGGRYGNVNPEDGWRYRGGGLMQTTFHDNYDAIHHADDPETVRTPIGGLRAALNYWQSHGCNAIADTDGTSASSTAVATTLRKVIQGGDQGLGEVFKALPILKGIFTDLGTATPIAAPIDLNGPKPFAPKSVPLPGPTAPAAKATGGRGARLLIYGLLAIFVFALIWWYLAGGAHAQAVVASTPVVHDWRLWGTSISVEDIVVNVLYPLALAAVPAVGAFFAYLQHKITHKTMEAADRNALQEALTNVAGLGSRWLGDAVHTTKFDIGNPVIAELVRRVIAASPDAIKRFGLEAQPQLIADKIEAKLPQIAASAATMISAPVVATATLESFEPLASAEARETGAV